VGIGVGAGGTANISESMKLGTKSQALVSVTKLLGHKTLRMPNVSQFNQIN